MMPLAGAGIMRVQFQDQIARYRAMIEGVGQAAILLRPLADLAHSAGSFRGRGYLFL